MCTFDQRLISARYSAKAGTPARLSASLENERDAVATKIASGIYVSEDRPCAVCDGRAFDVLAERDRYELPIRTVICQRCGFVQSSPIFRPRDYEDFYTHHYRRMYFAELVGEPDQLFLDQYWRGQRYVAYLLRHIPLAKNRLVVEVGCGAGGILAAFAERGFRVVGTDFGLENLAYGRARGLDLRVGPLSRVQLAEAPALILYSHVLEHVCELDKELQTVRDVLAADGFLFVSVPGVKDVRRNLFRGDFLRTFHIAHIYHFTLGSLAGLLARNGFEQVTGDETVRAIFRRGDYSAQARSDYADTRSYIQATERWRGFYSVRFGVRARALRVADGARAAAIGLLRTAGLYDLARKYVHRVRP